MAVADDLTSLTSRDRITQTVGHVVETTLKLLQQQFAGYTGTLVGLLVVLAELTFEREVNALGLLLLTQLQAVAHDLLGARLAVLARGEIALVDSTLVREATRTLEEQLDAIAPAKTADSSCVTCHYVLSFLTSGDDRFTRAKLLVSSRSETIQS